jgi:hypothetical protein
MSRKPYLAYPFRNFYLALRMTSALAEVVYRGPRRHVSSSPEAIEPKRIPAVGDGPRSACGWLPCLGPVWIS